MTEGAAVLDGLTTLEEAAFNLSKAAMMLDQSRDDYGKLAVALEKNMEVWIAIRTMMSQESVQVPKETRQNLVKLSQFVAQTTLAQGVEMPTDILDTFINIDLQISEGLLAGQKV